MNIFENIRDNSQAKDRDSTQEPDRDDEGGPALEQLTKDELSYDQVRRSQPC